MKYVEYSSYDPLGPKKIICYDKFKLNDDNEYHIAIGDIVKTICKAPDEDWKTQLARGYKDIPKDTELKIVGFTNNLYGNFIDVLYEGNRYSINPSKLELVSSLFSSDGNQLYTKSTESRSCVY